MATTAVTTRAYPKRKRAEISYHESSSDEVEVDDEYGASDEKLTARSRKKLKASHTAVSTKTLPKRNIFPFTSLPPELKNQIYALSLIDPDGIFLISKTKQYRRTIQRSVPYTVKSSGYYRRSRAYRHQAQSLPLNTSPAATIPVLTPNVLLLNRTIYAEAQPILYAGNTFAVEDTTAMHAFLAIIGPKNRATLTDLTIKGWGYTKAHKALNHPAFTLLAGAVNLTRLRIDCQILWGGPKRVAKQLYRDGFHWLEAVGATKGRVDAAVELIEIPEGILTTVYGYRRSQGDATSAEEVMEEFRAALRRMLH